MDPGRERGEVQILIDLGDLRPARLLTCPTSPDGTPIANITTRFGVTPTMVRSWI
jgi:hypothetical protein